VRSLTAGKFEISTPWPIVKSHDVALSALYSRQAIEVANHIRSENGDLAASLNVEAVSTGWEGGPTLYLEDHRGVDLVSEASAKLFEYRMLGLAGDGDAYLISRPSDETFENYIRASLNSGPVKIIKIEKSEMIGNASLSAACLRSSRALDHIIRSTISAGSLNIAPYQVTKDVWALAHKMLKFLSAQSVLQVQIHFCQKKQMTKLGLMILQKCCLDRTQFLSLILNIAWPPQPSQ